MWFSFLSGPKYLSLHLEITFLKKSRAGRDFKILRPSVLTIVALYVTLSDSGLPKNKKFELFSRKKIFIEKVFVVLKRSAFCFKISSFPFLVVVSVSYCIYCSWYVASKAWSSFTLQVYDWNF